jgi:hypothetical protein
MKLDANLYRQVGAEVDAEDPAEAEEPEAEEAEEA